MSVFRNALSSSTSSVSKLISREDGASDLVVVKSKLFPWIDWPSARAIGLDNLHFLVQIFEELGIELTTSHILEPELPLESINRVWSMRNQLEGKDLKMSKIFVYALRFQKLFLEFDCSKDNFESPDGNNLKTVSAQNEVYLSYNSKKV